MLDRKFMAGICAIALMGMAACQEKSNPSAAAESSKLALGAPATASADDSASAFPQWAFPGPLLKTIPGSAKKFSEVQMYDRTAAVDWFPDSHPPMPDVVKGRLPVYACGFCHLPQGAGRSENAALAGLPAKYILQQIADFKAGRRKTADPKFGPAANMELTVAQVPQADADAAAKYFSSLKYTKHIKVVESADVPHFLDNAFVYVFDASAPREPLGLRIIEGPDDFERFEMRDPNMTFTAYVPVGAIAAGAAVAKGNGGSRPACETCHGPGLKGTDIGPPIAGRLPTGIFRQLYGIQVGARNGANVAPMKAVVATLSRKDMIDVAAYVASLDP